MIEAFLPAPPPTASAAASEVMQYYGLSGDYIGGVWGTAIGALTLLIVLFTWRSTRRIDLKSKTYQIFAEMLRTHEEIISSIKIDDLQGREAFSEILSEFYRAYQEVDENSVDRPLLIRDKINIAYTFVYYGPHPHAIDILSERYKDFPLGTVQKNLSALRSSIVKQKIEAQLKKREGDPVWSAEVGKAMRLVSTIKLPNNQKEQLRDVLCQAQKRESRISIDILSKKIGEVHSSQNFGGHQNRLSHYFRNLYAAFIFIHEAKLPKSEKVNLAKVLRSKLSNYEQALLALNIISDLGKNWVESGLVENYMPIKNIPKRFFAFDKNFNLKNQFHTVTFEWEDRKQPKLCALRRIEAAVSKKFMERVKNGG